MRWTKKTVEFVVSPSLAAVPGAEAAVTRALAGWSGVGGAPEVTVRRGDGSEKAQNDGVNVVVYTQDGYAGASGALAVTALSYDTGSGEIVDADIVINGAYSFAILEDDATAPPGTVAISTEGGEHDREHAEFDIVHVLAHEAGHALGLSDEPTLTSALMYGYTMPGDASRRAPAADDLAGLSSQYAGATLHGQTHGCGGATVAPGRVSGGGAFMPLASAVVVFSLLRRRRGAANESASRRSQ